MNNALCYKLGVVWLEIVKKEDKNEKAQIYSNTKLHRIDNEKTFKFHKQKTYLPCKLENKKMNFIRKLYLKYYTKLSISCTEN